MSDEIEAASKSLNAHPTVSRMKSYIAIDISKTKLDLYDGNRTWSLDNQPTILRKWIRRLPAGTHLVCEASGGYERPVLDAAWNGRIDISLVHAARVRQFARAAGILAKNDQIDARVIHRFAHAIPPAITPQPSPEQRKINELFHHRLALMEDLTRNRNRLGQARDRFIQTQLTQIIVALRKRIESLQKQIDQILKRDDFRKQIQQLEQISGIGRQTSTALISLLPELGTLRRESIAALVGLAPFDCESGKWKGARKIQGGRSPIRRCLYMAALVASRHNPVLRPYYAKLLKSGKKKKVALVAVMRKLLIHCNSEIRKLTII